jgi:hypothetical protein
MTAYQLGQPSVAFHDRSPILGQPEIRSWLFLPITDRKLLASQSISPSMRWALSIVGGW